MLNKYVCKCNCNIAATLFLKKLEKIIVPYGKFIVNKTQKLIVRSFQYAFSVIAGLSTIAGLWGYTIKDINEDLSWWKWGIILLGIFAILSVTQTSQYKIPRSTLKIQ